MGNHVLWSYRSCRHCSVKFSKLSTNYYFTFLTFNLLKCRIIVVDFFLISSLLSVHLRNIDFYIFLINISCFGFMTWLFQSWIQNFREILNPILCKICLSRYLAQLFNKKQWIIIFKIFLKTQWNQELFFGRVSLWRFEILNLKFSKMGT